MFGGDKNFKIPIVLDSPLIWEITKVYKDALSGEHKELFEQIKQNGLLLSEQFPDSKVEKLSLVRRNRIISGISESIIIVTSSFQGGTLTQLKIAYNQHIPIFCPALSLNLLPNEGIKEGLKSYNAKEINDILPVIKQIEKTNIFSYT